MSMNEADHLYSFIMDKLYENNLTERSLVKAVMDLYDLAEEAAEMKRRWQRGLNENKGNETD